ncbi:MAG: CHAT domain-containing protein [Cyanobacteria bacterium P01_A01_bin.83]
MSSKLRQRLWLLLILIIAGLTCSLLVNNYYAAPVHAVSSESIVSTTSSKNAIELEAQGRYFYSIAQFQQAANSWQQAIRIYGAEDPLNQARVLSNLALAQGQLNQWSEANSNIAAGLNLLGDESQIETSRRVHAMAQILNNKGILKLNQGQAESAIAIWSQAKDYYQQAGDELGVVRAAINQAGAFKQLGFYRRALATFAEIESNLSHQPNSLIKVAALRSHGDLLRLMGQVERSRQVLQQSLAIASSLESTREKVKILLVLGNTYKTSNLKQAQKFYTQGKKICQQQGSCLQTDLPLQIYLAQLSSTLKTPDFDAAARLIPLINAEFSRLPVNRANLDRKVNFAQSLIELTNYNFPQDHQITGIPNTLEIEKFLEEVIDQAKTIDYAKAQSYALGLQGKIREQLQDWSQAQQYSIDALTIAQRINAPEISYLWQWQLGRINQAFGDRAIAINFYVQAIELLKSLSRDLVTINSDIQYSFRDGVEPVYRELVSLLLEADSKIEVNQGDLERARKVIESLQLAELNNFFQEACLEAKIVDIDRLDPQAAVIYPIILDDRLEVILSLPNQPLKHYASKIPQQQLEAMIVQFRQEIVVRSRRDFYQPASKLYDLLIRPAQKDLVNDQIKTLVFIPNGIFGNIPLGALYDGERFLIEDYSIALTPGLQLLNPQPLEPKKLNAIAAGLSKGIKGFSALNYVNFELKEIESQIDSTVLLNQNFTAEALKEEIEFKDHPVVHIATHGQFSSSLKETFLLAWNEKININELDRILQTRNSNQDREIELLVLSACETATGDQRAALGLAGMALRAGARSTLATLWSVNDRATAKLMSNFYGQLAQQQVPKAEAVRQAQLLLLSDRTYRHPFYWAPYVLLGNWL